MPIKAKIIMCTLVVVLLSSCGMIDKANENKKLEEATPGFYQVGSGLSGTVYRKFQFDCEFEIMSPVSILATCTSIKTGTVYTEITDYYIDSTENLD